MQIIRQAYEIAKKDLRRCYGPLGIKTGALRNTYWSWDSFFASFGALELGDTDVVEKNFNSFLKYQTLEGAIPRRISAPFLIYHLNTVSGRFYISKKVPSYNSFFIHRIPRFQNLVFLISFSHFIRKTNRIDYLRKNYSKLKKQLEFILTICDPLDKLLVEGTMENWSETIDKKGKVLFTNVLFYKALIEFSYLSTLMKEDNYLKLAKEVKKNINKEFWNDDYYIDRINGDKRYNILSTDGNISAILYDVCTKEQAIKIQKKMLEYNLSYPVPVKTNYPLYPWKDLYFLNKFFLRNYHNNISKLWLGSLDCVAKYKIGMKKEAIEQLTKIAAQIVKDKTVVEVYDSDGKPLTTRFYRAERKFAWSAGLFIWAVHQIHKI